MRMYTRTICYLGNEYI